MKPTVIQETDDRQVDRGVQKSLAFILGEGGGLAPLLLRLVRRGVAASAAASTSSAASWSAGPPVEPLPCRWEADGRQTSGARLLLLPPSEQSEKGHVAEDPLDRC